MRKSKFSDEQMVRILREADRTDVTSAAKRHGISDQTIYVWRGRFGAMTVRRDDPRQHATPEVPRERKHEAQEAPRGPVARDRRAPGDQCKKMVSAHGRRRQVAYATRRGVSKRRACALLGVARSGLDYESIRDKQDAPVIARMRELAAQYNTVRPHSSLGYFDTAPVQAETESPTINLRESKFHGTRGPLKAGRSRAPRGRPAGERYPA